MLATHRARKPFVFTPLRHERPLGWSSPAFRELYRSYQGRVVAQLSHIVPRADLEDVFMNVTRGEVQ